MATTESLSAAQSENDPVEVIEPDQERYVRAAGDVLRLGTAIVVFIVTVLAAAVLRQVITGAEQEVVRLTALVPTPVAALLKSIAGTVGIFGPIAVAVTLVVIRRVRVAQMVLGGGLVAGVAMRGLSNLLSVQRILPASLGELRTITYPGPGYLAISGAVVTILGPWLPRSLRRVSIASVAVVAFSNIASGQYVPYEVGVALVFGWLVGVATLAAFGSINRRPSGASLSLIHI